MSTQPALRGPDTKLVVHPDRAAQFEQLRSELDRAARTPGLDPALTDSGDR